MRILPQSLHCNTRTFTTVCNPIWSSDPLWGCVGISFPLPGEHFNRLTSIYASNNVSHGQYCCSRIHTSEPLTYFFLLAPDSFLGSGVALKCPEHCIAKSNLISSYQIITRIKGSQSLLLLSGLNLSHTDKQQCKLAQDASFNKPASTNYLGPLAADAIPSNHSKFFKHTMFSDKRYAPLLARFKHQIFRTYPMFDVRSTTATFPQFLIT